jgi:hypothetical protein
MTEAERNRAIARAVTMSIAGLSLVAIAWTIRNVC